MRFFYLLISLPLAVLVHPLLGKESGDLRKSIQFGEYMHNYIHPQKQIIIELRNATHIITSKRDSVTIKIENSFQNTTVISSQNNAKFEVINNAKNANIAMGDKSNHTLDFDAFGDKNMLNSTGSNTGGWNTKNSDSNLTTGHQKTRRWWRRANFGLDDVVHGLFSQFKVVEVRDFVNLDIKGGSVKNSNVTRSGNGNTVEVYISGNGQNVVNITLSWEAGNSDVSDSNSENKVKIYIGDAQGIDMRNSTVLVAAQEI